MKHFYEAKMPLRSFSIYSRAQGLRLRVVSFPNEIPLEKLFFFICKWLSIAASFWVMDGDPCPLLLSALGLHLIQTCPGPVHADCPQSLRVHTCIGLLCLEGLTLFPGCPPSHWLLYFSCLLFCKVKTKSLRLGI